MIVSQLIPAVYFSLTGFGDGMFYQFLAFIIERRTYNGIFDEHHVISWFHICPDAEPGLFLLFNAYRVRGSFFAVLEELIGHSIAHLRIFPTGLRP